VDFDFGSNQKQNRPHPQPSPPDMGEGANMQVADLLIFFIGSERNAKQTD
jgi:hypothetical protein